MENGDDRRLDKPNVTVSQTEFSVTEGDTIEITLTADKAISQTMQFKLELLAGSTGSFRDYTVLENDVVTDETNPDIGTGTIGHVINMPAYTTSYTFKIVPELDIHPEGTEVFNFRLYGDSNSTGIVEPSSENITVNVANGTSDDFVVEMQWNGNHTTWFGNIEPTTYTGVDDQEHEYCDFDFDMEIYDAGFTPQFVDYNNCPAVTGIPADAPDGEYIIVPSFWDNASSAGAVPASGEIVYPVIVTMGKPGVFEHTTDLTGTFTYTAGGANNGNADAYVPIATVTKTGTTYVLRDYNNPDVILGQGRMAQIKNMLKHGKVAKK
ncbi:MAG: hypothetical protein EOO51_10115 [Flavobacterium sp.]|nr:MAG: hypothetical protein EOO51_10115 [Flavobacterium sp.]